MTTHVGVATGTSLYTVAVRNCAGSHTFTVPTLTFTTETTAHVGGHQIHVPAGGAITAARCMRTSTHSVLVLRQHTTGAALQIAASTAMVHNVVINTGHRSRPAVDVTYGPAHGPIRGALPLHPAIARITPTYATSA